MWFRAVEDTSTSEITWLRSLRTYVHFPINVCWYQLNPSVILPKIFKQGPVPNLLDVLWAENNLCHHTPIPDWPTCYWTYTHFFSVRLLLNYSPEYEGAKEHMRFKVLLHVLQAFLLLKFLRVTSEMSKSITFWSDTVKIFKNRHSDGEFKSLYYLLHPIESHFWKQILGA